MAENMIHFRREEDAGAPMLSVAAHPTDPENTLVVQSWGRPISLHVDEALDLLDFLSKYRAAIFALAEKHEQSQRDALLQEVGHLASALHFDIQIEDGLIDLISRHTYSDGQATSFRADLDGLAAALAWLKARQPESEG